MIKYKDIDLNNSLEGKTAVVTGGAAGIGNATAEFLAKKGVKVALVDLSDKVAEAAQKLGEGCIGIKADITDPAQVKSAVDEAAAKLSKIDILVNSAGIVALDDAEKLSIDMWNKTMAVNLTGSFMMAQAVGNKMIETGGDDNYSIVNIASQAGRVALDKHVAYCTSKGGIVAMTKVLAYEWAKYGIRVNCISPTIVLTELGHKAWDGPAGDAMKKIIPAGRFAEPDEIAGCIAFLCSNAAAMITGEDLVIDGGYTIQ